MSNIIVAGLFHTSEQAMSAVTALEGAGYSQSELNLVCDRGASAHDENHRKVVGAVADVAPDFTPSVGMGTAIGAASGTAFGILAAAAGISVLPFAAPVVAFGWLATTAASAIWGGGIGSFVAWMMEHGVPSSLGEHYGQAVNKGQALVMVKLDSVDTARATQAEEVMRLHGMLTPPSSGAMHAE